MRRRGELGRRRRERRGRREGRRCWVFGAVGSPGPECRRSGVRSTRCCYGLNVAADVPCLQRLLQGSSFLVSLRKPSAASSSQSTPLVSAPRHLASTKAFDSPAGEPVSA
uniref:Uncharacterized protein n=1 Tax=Rhipicephalus zambeziensis TaxID=60191 RepID=A0A224Y9V7_9ACAR